MSIASYIPFTQARRQRLMKASWQSYAQGYDGLAMVEWPDGSKSPKPVHWDDELNALTTDDGKKFFVRGRAAEPRQLFGIPVWDVNAEGLGVVSTEAALLADREHYEEFQEGTPDEIQLEANGSQEAMADGGQAVKGTVYNRKPDRVTSTERGSASRSRPITRRSQPRRLTPSRQSHRQSRRRTTIPRT